MNRKNGLMKNTLILAVSMILTKIIGAVLKIPLTNILGGMGMGYFSTAYSLFSPVYAFLAAGLPTVITKQVAQATACKKYKTVRKIKGTALIISAVLGVAGSVFVFAAATPFAKYIANSYESRFAIITIAPSVFFCCVAAVYKGSDAFWFIQWACESEEYEEYRPHFVNWAKLVDVSASNSN